MRDVHSCVTVFYQQIENGSIANQIQGFTIDYGRFILMTVMVFKHIPWRNRMPDVRILIFGRLYLRGISIIYFTCNFQWLKENVCVTCLQIKLISVEITFFNFGCLVSSSH